MTEMRRLVRDESGMTMGITVIMIVLIGVMGAGLLTFVQRDLDTVLQENQGQKAFELADGGVQAARQQLIDQNIPANYNGGSDDVQWSSSKSGMNLTNLDGNSATSDAVNVSITYQALTVDTFVVVSTGTYGDAKRKVESVFTRTGAIKGIPPAYFTRNNLTIGGNITVNAVSLFAQGNAQVNGTSMTFGPDADVMGKWAQAVGSGSFPNAFNNTPRGSAQPGVAAQGLMTGSPTSLLNVGKGTGKSYDKATLPAVVTNYYQSPLLEPAKIAFPFSTDELVNDIEVLRTTAQQQEAATPSEDHYKDNLSGSVDINSWPTGEGYDDVYFFRFPTWSSTNQVRWNMTLPCTDYTRKGIIVVENGNFLLDGNRGGFNGTVVVYGGKDPNSGQPYNNRGTFTSAGGACMHGYATSSGDMTLTGNYNAASIPGITTLPIFAGGLNQTSWRELYQ